MGQVGMAQEYALRTVWYDVNYWRITEMSQYNKHLKDVERFFVGVETG